MAFLEDFLFVPAIQLEMWKLIIKGVGTFQVSPQNLFLKKYALYAKFWAIHFLLKLVFIHLNLSMASSGDSYIQRLQPWEDKHWSSLNLKKSLGLQKISEVYLRFKNNNKVNRSSTVAVRNKCPLWLLFGNHNSIVSKRFCFCQ